MLKIKFEKTEIFEINGSSKTLFEGEYTPIELANKLISEWIAYYECHKCGKGDYCKYVIPLSANPKLKEDIQCGVVVNALKNFILQTFYILENSSLLKKQTYLDSAYYFCKYLLQSEQLNGIFIDNGKLNYWGNYAKLFYAQIIPIRDTLNDFGKCFKEFPELYKGTSLLLVEGQSELTFIENLKGDGNYSKSWDFVIDCYHGKGNKLPRRIQMLLDDYKKRGYSIYMQGDEDGTGNGSGFDKFINYVENEYLPKENIFQFKYDFETSIPKKLLYNILVSFNYLNNISFAEFDKKTNDKSINKSLKDEFGIDTSLDKLKIRIAKVVGNSVFHIDQSIKDKFNLTELGKFVAFLENIK